MPFIVAFLIGFWSPANDLVSAPGVNLVRAHCTSCHSHHLITQNRGTRNDWLLTIRWMQEKQNLWAIAPETESKILDYLAQHYPPQRTSRRPPLHPSLMPPRTDPAPISNTISSQTTAARSAESTVPPSHGCSCDLSGPFSACFLGIFVLFGAMRRLIR